MKRLYIMNLESKDKTTLVRVVDIEDDQRMYDQEQIVGALLDLFHLEKQAQGGGSPYALMTLQAIGQRYGLEKDDPAIMKAWELV